MDYRICNMDYGVCNMDYGIWMIKSGMWNFNSKIMGIRMNSKTEELLERTFLFGVDTLRFLLQLPKNKIFSIISFQLAKSSTSSGANYEEAQAAESKRDFEHKIGVVLKEIRESNYWYRVINNILPDYNANKELKRLLNESLELKKIFTTIKFNVGRK